MIRILKARSRQDRRRKVPATSHADEAIEQVVLP
jgi:hypothetical protein